MYILKNLLLKTGRQPTHNYSSKRFAITITPSSGKIFVFTHNASDKTSSSLLYKFIRMWISVQYTILIQSNSL